VLNNPCQRVVCPLIPNLLWLKTLRSSVESHHPLEKIGVEEIPGGWTFPSHGLWYHGKKETLSRINDNEETNQQFMNLVLQKSATLQTMAKVRGRHIPVRLVQCIFVLYLKLFLLHSSSGQRPFRYFTRWVSHSTAELLAIHPFPRTCLLTNRGRRAGRNGIDRKRRETVTPRRGGRTKIK